MPDMVQVRRGQQQRYKGPDAKIGRSQFNRSHGLKMSFDASYLYPIFLDEVLPGDTMTMRLNGFARIFSPLDAPVMDNIELETFFFFCPTRILWDNWAFFNGEHDAAGAQDTTFTIPVMDTGLTVDHDNVKTVHGLAAHMGLPDGLATATVTGVSALPFRMYNQVINNWFRDQNLTSALGLPELTDNGPDAPVANYVLTKSNKKHDYFTSALPYVQKSVPASSGALGLTGELKVEMNLGTTGDIPTVWAQDAGAYRTLDAAAATVDVSAAAGGGIADRLLVDLSDGGTIDLNALRLSLAIQRSLEKDARGGTRYVELIKTHFGVTSPDFRLQRPEYLGGGKALINISPVANTSGVDSTVSISGIDEPQGELRGIGTGVIRGHSWAKSFTEHGYIMGLIRARGDITYFQGLDKLWSRSTRYDFYLPDFANLGEQSILNKELWVSNVAATDDAVFGFQERWAEYRMKASKVVGNFNPDVSGALAHWHLAEDFSSLPALNTTFVNDNTPMSRITTVTTEPDFLLDVWFDYKCARPLPVYSIPALMARF